MRADRRHFDQMREVKITKGFICHAEGSALIEMGKTKVICTVSVEDKVPPFLKDQKRGWITSEYGMLPRSTASRMSREASVGRVGGRTHEIQRLIGRSLRAVVDLNALGERTLWVDCDVIQADGGTRTASITGAFVALADAIANLKNQKLIQGSPIKDLVAAVSVGIVNGQELVDLNYFEDSSAEVDMNVVMTGSGKFIELQGTAEKVPFDELQLTRLLTLAKNAIAKLHEIQRELVTL